MLMPPTVSSASYDAANRLTTWGGNALTYDDNGNLTALGATTYGWNARDQLAATSSGGSTFSYDVLGRRTGRNVSGNATSYLHDGPNPVSVNDDFMVSGLSVDEIYAGISSSGTTSYATDGINNTRLLTDEDGDVIASYSYAPYGAAATADSGQTNFQFTGRENDGAANLYYYRARYYSPALSRFISEDPIGLSGGVNLYTYVYGDPVSLVDPYGLVDSLPQWVVDGFTGFGDGVYAAITLGLGDLQDVRDLLQIDGGINPCSDIYGALNTAGNIVGGTALGGAVFTKVAGPVGNWIRFGKSYSQNLKAPVKFSLRWGASEAKKGKYLKQIPTAFMRNVNQSVRKIRIPLPRPRFADPGHWHLWF